MKRVTTIEMELTLTVEAALRRPAFRNAQVAAGQGGLRRPIRWVHVLETPHFDELLHGEEMILTTGMGFRLDSSAAADYVEKLISHNASCLCIELGPYFETMSPELLELADRKDFPLILFPDTVRFVDITQDLHTLILSGHQNTLRELEAISREFHRLTLTSQGTGNVLKLLQKSTQTYLLFYPVQGNPLFQPALPPEEQEELLKFAESRRLLLDEAKPNAAPDVHPFREKVAIVKPVGAQSQTWAYLIMVCERQPREYDYLLLDSASLSIAQELLRTRYMEERRFFAENLWVEELLNGKPEDDKQIQALATPHISRIHDLHYRVCLIGLHDAPETADVERESEWEALRHPLSLLTRSTFEKLGYRTFITYRNNRLAVIVIDQKNKIRAKERLEQALRTLTGAGSEPRLKGRLYACSGNAYSHLRDAAESAKEAAHAVSLLPVTGRTVLLYEDLGIYQLLVHLNDGAILQRFVERYLGPLLEYDTAKGSELVATLQVYLDHDGSKQIAAQKLFIVRQSLYYRLEKIKELLGFDIMAPEHRISLQTALCAYRLLYPERSTGGHRTGAGTKHLETADSTENQGTAGRG